MFGAVVAVNVRHTQQEDRIRVKGYVVKDQLEWMILNKSKFDHFALVIKESTDICQDFLNKLFLLLARVATLPHCLK